MVFELSFYFSFLIKNCVISHQFITTWVYTGQDDHIKLSSISNKISYKMEIWVFQIGIVGKEKNFSSTLLALVPGSVN